MERLAGNIVLMWGWRRTLVALLSGSALVLAQAPYDFFPVGFVCFPLIVWLIDGATGEPRDTVFGRLRAAFGIGWWFGLGYFGFGLWWVGKALMVDAESHAWALPFAVLGIPALLAIFYGLATAIARLFWSDGIGRIAALAFGFGVAEWLRATLFTGFPWLSMGYAAMPLPLLMQSVHLVGLFGMNALAVFVFAMPALLADGKHLRAGLAAAALLAVAHVGYGAARLTAPPDETDATLSVRIVQPSIAQDGKWDPAQREAILKRLIDLSIAPDETQASVDVVVWPETALPYLLAERAQMLVDIGEMLADGQELLVGAVRSEAAVTPGAAARYYNAVAAINDRGEIVDAVDKVHLVPFGEYLPLKPLFDAFGIGAIADTFGGFFPGSVRHAIAVGDGARLLPMICYEIIFPQLMRPAEVGANVIVNLTNDAWFGDTPGPYQHFRQAQVRAVEAGLPMIRAANNGLSAVVDEKGRIVDAFGLDAVGALDATVAYRTRPPADTIPRRSISLATILFFATLACGMSVGLRLRL
ncbi:apolipoprotein N-acyltransferase [Mesorhizobium xinjiangense]|uniref:apolipoprotein N-acyltransferase n=1 Tax=Mesorhizobium xinjiangense TaxID=2678685 RepID=UPI0012ED07EC|nr:apolipoprotein N-acyltransferase [Mesorhizobium xinjiangense]